MTTRQVILVTSVLEWVDHPQVRLVQPGNDGGGDDDDDDDAQISSKHYWTISDIFW